MSESKKESFRIRNLFSVNPNVDSPSDAAQKTALGGAIMGSFYGATQNFWFAYPQRQALPNLLKCSALGALYSATYFATSTYVAQKRGGEDFLSAAVAGMSTGLLVAVKSPRIVKWIGLSTFGAVLSMGYYWAKKDIEFIASQPSMKDNQWSRSKDFFENPRPDPFRRRWEQLKARGLPGTKVAETADK